MSHKGFGKGSRHGEKSRERISRSLRRHFELKRKEAKVRPRDLDRLRSSGSVSSALRPLIAIAESEAAELSDALGGPDFVTPQRRILIEDVCAVGMALRGTLSLYLQTGEPELSSRIATLANARRMSLQALGLDFFKREVDLNTYLEQKAREAPQDAPEATIVSADEQRAGNSQ